MSHEIHILDIVLVMKDEWKLYEYKKNRVKKCRGSGYCNTYVNHNPFLGKLIEKKNLKAKFLAS